MAVNFLANTIPLPLKRAQVEAAVQAGLRNHSGNWQAEILVDQKTAGLLIRLEGPEGEKWSHIFEGPGESEPEHIKETIELAGTV